MTMKVWKIKTQTLVTLKLGTTATQIIVAKTPNDTCGNFCIQSVESSYLSAVVSDISFRTMLTQICQHFSLVINFSNRGYRRRIFSFLSIFELVSFTVTVVREYLITKHGRADNAGIFKQICLLKMWDWRMESCMPRS